MHRILYVCHLNKIQTRQKVTRQKVIRQIENPIQLHSAYTAYTLPVHCRCTPVQAEPLQRQMGSLQRQVAFFSTFRRIHTLIGHRAEISSAQFNWDCSLIATGSMDKTCKIWDANNG